MLPRDWSVLPNNLISAKIAQIHTITTYLPYFSLVGHMPHIRRAKILWVELSNNPVGICYNEAGSRLY